MSGGQMKQNNLVAIIRNNEVTLLNKEVGVSPFHDTVINPTTIEITKSNLLIVEGYQVEYEFKMYEIHEGDEDFEKYHEDAVKTRKGWFFFGKPYRYIPRGWGKQKKKTKVRYTFSCWKLITGAPVE